MPNIAVMYFPGNNCEEETLDAERNEPDDQVHSRSDAGTGLRFPLRISTRRSRRRILR